MVWFSSSACIGNSRGRRADEPDEQDVRGGDGAVHQRRRHRGDLIPKGAAEGRCDGRAASEVQRRRGDRLYRQGAGEDTGIAHRKAEKSAYGPELSVDRQIGGDGETLLRVRAGSGLRTVLFKVLLVLSLHCEAVPQRARV